MEAETLKAEDAEVAENTEEIDRAPVPIPVSSLPVLDSEDEASSPDDKRGAAPPQHTSLDGDREDQSPPENATVPSVATAGDEEGKAEAPARECGIRQKLVDFYSVHNPSKLATVDSILEQYQGQEDLLLRLLHEKYATRQPLPTGDKVRAHGKGSGGGGAGGGDAAESTGNGGSAITNASTSPLLDDGSSTSSTSAGSVAAASAYTAKASQSLYFLAHQLKTNVNSLLVPVPQKAPLPTAALTGVLAATAVASPRVDGDVSVPSSGREPAAPGSLPSGAGPRHIASMSDTEISNTVSLADGLLPAGAPVSDPAAAAAAAIAASPLMAPGGAGLRAEDAQLPH
ncbi:unnamed protein product, partial [Phaeothamnion confervicola]